MSSRGACTASCWFESLLTINGHMLLLVHTCVSVAHVRHATSSLLTYIVVFFVCLFTCSHSSSMLPLSHLFHTTLLEYDTFFFVLNHPQFYHHISLPTLIHTHYRYLNTLSVSLSYRHHIFITPSLRTRTRTAQPHRIQQAPEVQQVQSGLCLESLGQTQDWGWGSDLFCLRCGKYSHTKENYQGKRCYAKVKCNHCASSQSDKRVGLVPLLH